MSSQYEPHARDAFLVAGKSSNVIYRTARTIRKPLIHEPPSITLKASPESIISLSQHQYIYNNTSKQTYNSEKTRRIKYNTKSLLLERLGLGEGYAELDALDEGPDVVRVRQILGVNHGLSQGIAAPQAQIAPALRVENRRDDEDYAIRALLLADHARLRAVGQVAPEDQLDIRMILVPVRVLGVYHRRHLGYSCATGGNWDHSLV